MIDLTSRGLEAEGLYPPKLHIDTKQRLALFDTAIRELNGDTDDHSVLISQLTAYRDEFVVSQSSEKLNQLSLQILDSVLSCRTNNPQTDPVILAYGNSGGDVIEKVLKCFSGEGQGRWHIEHPPYSLLTAFAGFVEYARFNARDLSSSQFQFSSDPAEAQDARRRIPINLESERSVVRSMRILRAVGLHPEEMKTVEEFLRIDDYLKIEPRALDLALYAKEAYVQSVELFGRGEELAGLSLSADFSHAIERLKPQLQKAIHKLTNPDVVEGYVWNMLDKAHEVFSHFEPGAVKYTEKAVELTVKLLEAHYDGRSVKPDVEELLLLLNRGKEQLSIELVLNSMEAMMAQETLRSVILYRDEERIYRRFLNLKDVRYGTLDSESQPRDVFPLGQILTSLQNAESFSGGAHSLEFDARRNSKESPLLFRYANWFSKKGVRKFHLENPKAYPGPGFILQGLDAEGAFGADFKSSKNPFQKKLSEYVIDRSAFDYIDQSDFIYHRGYLGVRGPSLFLNYPGKEKVSYSLLTLNRHFRGGNVVKTIAVPDFIVERWIKLHSYSTSIDSTYTTYDVEPLSESTFALPAIIKEAKANGLEVYDITNHSNCLWSYHNTRTIYSLNEDMSPNFTGLSFANELAQFFHRAESLMWLSAFAFSKWRVDANYEKDVPLLANEFVDWHDTIQLMRDEEIDPRFSPTLVIQDTVDRGVPVDPELEWRVSDLTLKIKGEPDRRVERGDINEVWNQIVKPRYVQNGSQWMFKEPRLVRGDLIYRSDAE